MVGEYSSTTGGPGDDMAARDERDLSRDVPGRLCMLDGTLAAVLAPVPLPVLGVCLRRGAVIWANREASPDDVARDALLGRPLVELVAPDDRATVRVLMSSQGGGGDERRLVTTVTLPGRLPQRCETTWLTTAGTEGCPLAVLYLREMVPAPGDALEASGQLSVRLGDVESVVCEADGTIRWISPATAAALEQNGRSSVQLVGRSIFEVGSPTLRLEAKAIYDDVIGVPGSIATRTVFSAHEAEPGHFVVHAQNRLADPEIKGLVWWRQRVDTPPEGSTSLERRLAVLERTLETISQELHTAGFAARERRVPYWRRLPGAELLNDREERVVDLLAQGLRVPSIAQRLYVSQSTVRNNLSAIYRKLGVVSQVELLELLVAEEGSAPTE